MSKKFKNDSQRKAVMSKYNTGRAGKPIPSTYKPSVNHNVKKLKGTPIKYTTASQKYNALSGGHSQPHDFKSNDTFVVNDDKIAMISFYGDKPEILLYKDGTLVENSDFTGNDNFSADIKLIKDYDYKNKKQAVYEITLKTKK